jgi:hypothetical protein
MGGELELLLVSCGGGNAVHLAGLGVDEPGVPAVSDDHFADTWLDRIPALSNHDRGALLAPRWSARTLCGREWAVMIGGDGGSISPFAGEEPAFAPSCRRCLAVMDRLFPAPPQHPQLALVAKVVADTVLEHGHAELHGVLGDQQAELRRRVRALVRELIGQGCQTLLHGSILFVICEALLKRHEAENNAAILAALDDEFAGRPRAALTPSWRLSWSTWATS